MVRGRRGKYLTAGVSELGYDVTAIAGSAQEKFIKAVNVPAPRAEAIHRACVCRRPSCFSPVAEAAALAEAPSTVLALLPHSSPGAKGLGRLSCSCRFISLPSIYMSQTHHCVVSESTVPEKCVHGVHKGANDPEEQESEQVCSLCDLCCAASDAAYNTTLLHCIILIIASFD